MTRLGVIHDGPDRALDVMLAADPTNDNAVLLSRYTHDAQIDSPLELEVTAAANDRAGTYTYRTDHLGSVRMLTDINGDVASAYRYDSYGRPTLDIAGVAQPFGYTARERDRATDLYHYRARAYDPSTGRFLQEDPLGFGAGDLNIYRYVLSNPLSSTDPLGLSAFAGSYGKQNKNGASPARIAAMRAVACSINTTFTGLASTLAGATSGGEYQGMIVNPGACSALAVFTEIERKPIGEGSPQELRLCIIHATQGGEA